MGDYSRDAFGQNREPMPNQRYEADDHGWAATEYDKAMQSYAEMARRYAPPYDHCRTYDEAAEEYRRAHRYVPDVGLDGFGEPAATYARREAERLAAESREEDSDEIDFEGDATIGEIVVSVTCIALLVVGAVTVVKAAARIGMRLLRAT